MKLNVTIVILILTVSGLTSGCGFEDCVPPSEMVGRWKGACEIIVTWCAQDSLSISLTISADGAVEGAIGDATIEDGHVKRNASMAALLGNPEYVIQADLTGPIVEAENITRESFTMIVWTEGDRLVGQIDTSGSTFGGKESMIMTCVDIELTRSEE